MIFYRAALLQTRQRSAAVPDGIGIPNLKYFRSYDDHQGGNQEEQAHNDKDTEADFL